MDALVRTHSGLRYIVLALLLLAIFNAIAGTLKGTYVKKDKMINLFAMISMHIQLLIGLVLYVSYWFSKVPEGAAMKMPIRFYTVEHITMMVAAIVLVTIGRKRSEAVGLIDIKRHVIIRNYFGIALIVIFFAIPWPFLRDGLGAGWF